jgi:hypothetical protein
LDLYKFKWNFHDWWQAMGGDIVVTSEEGSGSVFTFTVRLPVVDPAKGGSRSVSPLEKEPSASYPSLPPPARASSLLHPGVSDLRLARFVCRVVLEGTKVLVVEDNAINQKVVTKMLTSLGCHVTVLCLYLHKTLIN